MHLVACVVWLELSRVCVCVCVCWFHAVHLFDVVVDAGGRAAVAGAGGTRATVEHRLNRKVDLHAQGPWAARHLDTVAERRQAGVGPA